jgi:putative FmdB family regulatory protein
MVIIVAGVQQEVFLPLYEYQCAKCGARIEKIQKFSDPPLIKCGNCGGRLERLLSSPAIQFKGSGWYVTDYARKSARPAGANAESPPEGGEKKAPEPAKKALTSATSKSKDH